MLFGGLPGKTAVNPPTERPPGTGPKLLEQQRVIAGEQLCSCVAAAPVVPVVTGLLGGVLRGYSQPRRLRAGVLPPLP